MSGERTEERLDAMLAALRGRPGHLDEITRARVGARLEAALAKIDDVADARASRGWRRRGLAAGVGLAAAAVAAVVAAATGRGTTEGETAAVAISDSIGGSAAAVAAGPSAARAGAAPGSASGAGPAPHAAGSSAAPAEESAPVTVAAGELAQLTLEGTAITVYGPGRLSPTRDGAIVEAAGIVVDRAHGEAPWSLRYHGIEIVATRATFVVDYAGGTRVTVMRGELELRCSSGPRTIASGASATCEPPAKAHPAPGPRPPVRTAQPPRAPHPQALDPQVPDPQPRPDPTADRYSAADRALRRGDLDAAHDALLAIADAAPESLDAATALLDLARLAVRRGDPAAARGYLDRLDRHPHRAALAAPAARLLGTLSRGTTLRAP